MISLGALLNFSCKRESSDLAFDLVRNIAALIREETPRIDFQKSAGHREYLRRGWSYQEEDFTWAQDKNCSVEFYRYDLQNNLEIEAVCRTIPSRDGKRQDVSLFLNGEKVGSFLPDAASFQPISLTLPASALNLGRNILEFRSSYGSKPSEIYPGSRDARDLSLAFQKIEFGQNLRCLDDKGLIQKANSTFSAFVILPHRFELNIRYQNFSNTSSSVVLIDESKNGIPIILPPGKKRYKKTIRLEKKGIYELRFAAEGPREGYTIWSKIDVVNLKTPVENSQKARKTRKLNKPDILIYIIDALRADHMSCYGYERLTTPNIDKFAEENTRYLNAYANTSWTKASGAAILTGLYPKHNKTMTRDDKMPDEIMTLAEILRDTGYFTAAFIGNGNLSHVFGFDQGFDVFEEFFGTYSYSRHVQSNRINEKVFEFLQEFLEKDERKPLFLLIWTVDPHDPYTPEESVKNLFDIHRYAPLDTYSFSFLEDVRKGEIRPSLSQIEFVKVRYDQEIFFNDRSFGELLTSMKNQGIYDDAVIIFTSDHGEEFFDHAGVGHGLTLYNEQIKIPLIAKIPQNGKSSDTNRVQHIDIFPTILDILRLNPPYELDGTSLFSIVNPLRTLYFEEKLGLNDLNAVLDHERKLIYNRRFDPRLSKIMIPALESFAVEDESESENLSLEGLSDRLRLQDLLFYRNSMDKFIAERQKADIPEDLDQKLKALGYIK